MTNNPSKEGDFSLEENTLPGFQLKVILFQAVECFPKVDHMVLETFSQDEQIIQIGQHLFP